MQINSTHACDLVERVELHYDQAKSRVESFTINMFRLTNMLLVLAAILACTFADRSHELFSGDGWLWRVSQDSAPELEPERSLSIAARPPRNTLSDPSANTTYFFKFSFKNGVAGLESAVLDYFPREDQMLLGIRGLRYEFSSYRICGDTSAPFGQCNRADQPAPITSRIDPFGNSDTRRWSVRGPLYQRRGRRKRDTSKLAMDLIPYLTLQSKSQSGNAFYCSYFFANGNITIPSSTRGNPGIVRRIGPHELKCTAQIFVPGFNLACPRNYTVEVLPTLSYLAQPLTSAFAPLDTFTEGDLDYSRTAPTANMRILQAVTVDLEDSETNSTLILDPPEDEIDASNNLVQRFRFLSPQTRVIKTFNGKENITTFRCRAQFFIWDPTLSVLIDGTDLPLTAAESAVPGFSVPTTNNNVTTAALRNDSTTEIIIGCAIAGAVLVVIATILMVVLWRRYSQRKAENYLKSNEMERLRNGALGTQVG